MTFLQEAATPSSAFDILLNQGVLGAVAVLAIIAFVIVGRMLIAFLRESNVSAAKQAAAETESRLKLAEALDHLRETLTERDERLLIYAKENNEMLRSLMLTGRNGRS